VSVAPVLELKAVTSGYMGVPVVHDVDVSVAQGEVVTLLGANGAGKTTLLHTIIGAVKVLGGELRLDGKPLKGSVHARAREGIGLVTEERAIIRRLTVRENLKIGTRNVDEALELFPHLTQFLRKKAGLLSGGEQQMLVLARALANRPKVLLVDELSFGLAPLIVKQLLGSLREAAERGAAVLVVEQHPKLALEIADRGYVLTRGRIGMSGSSGELLARLPEIEEAYLSAVNTNGDGSS
jgi:ABC-type branched-subunit amino acid transport system ATPase component